MADWQQTDILMIRHPLRTRCRRDCVMIGHMHCNSNRLLKLRGHEADPEAKIWPRPLDANSFSELSVQILNKH